MSRVHASSGMSKEVEVEDFIMNSAASKVVGLARNAFNSGTTKPIQWRLQQLQRLLDMINENHNQINDAIYKDFKKPKFEMEIMELMIVRNEILHAMKNLHSWMKPTYPSTTFAQTFDSLVMQNEPLGVVLVISAWNYPIQLLLAPLVGIIAAGNCAVIKPSDLCENLSALLENLIPRYLNETCFPVFCGGIPETTELLNERFDHIIFTGSSPVGKVVMSAAAKHLTPVTLELGGKSPVYIDRGSDLNMVAKRISWGKFCNAGQTCISPDYVLCHREVQDRFAVEMTRVITSWYGDEPKRSPDYARIVNQRHHKRLCDVIARMSSNKLVVGGDSDVDDKYIAPTVYKNVEEGDSVMEGELFGPILPLIPVDGHDSAIEIINSKEKPLALYVFSNNNQVVEEFMSRTSSGGVTVNDTMMHGGLYNLPFGGVGSSGMGAYHGKHSFDTFSHKKPIMKRKQNLEMLVSARYPPYTDKNQATLQSLLQEKKSGWCSIQ